MGRKHFDSNPRLVKVYDFLKAQIAKRGIPPTLREICQGTGITSTSVVSYYLNRLQEQGLINIDRNISRGVSLPDNPYEDMMTRVVAVLEPFARASKNGVYNLVLDDYSEAAILYRELTGKDPVNPRGNLIKSIRVKSEMVAA